ncbi:MAG: alpha/beta hydrolase [Planctomycetota bacterium]|nr:MAG: alpha/beta hydrolase [Planctomycetota bacterium]
MPGLDGTGIMFEPFLKVLAPEIRTTVISYPSEDKPLSYQQLISHAEGKIPRDRPIVILAESFSGPIAINLLGRGMPNVKGAVFCATFARPPYPFLLEFTKLLPLDQLFRLPMPDFALGKFCFGPDAPDSLPALLQKAVETAKPVNIAARFKMLADIDELSALRKIKIPCCYIQASADHLVPSNCIEPFREALHDLVVRKIDGPHFLLQVKPAETLEVIYEFVNNL